MALTSTLLLPLLLTFTISSTHAQRGAPGTTSLSPITLSSTGGFSIGGHTIRSPTSPSTTLTCDWGYMEYFIPTRPRLTSIILWHSAHTQAFQNNWSGGQGFKDLLLRKSYPVYLWDGPRVGRANWACDPTTYTPSYRDQGNFAGWNFGPRFQEWWPGVQFPTEDEEAWKAATRTRYVEYDTPENVEIETDAAVAAADSGRLGDSVVYVTNSASGLRALLTAVKSQTGNVRAIIAYETIGLLFPDDAEDVPGGGGFGGAFAPTIIAAEEFEKLAALDVVQFVWGDNRDESFLYYNQSKVLMELINERGGNAEFLKLAEDEGLVGSTHSPFADLDNDKVARLVEDLLERYGLDGYVEEEPEQRRRWLGLW